LKGSNKHVTQTSLQTTGRTADRYEIFTRDSQHEWAFMGGSMTFPNKSKMANSGDIEFRKMLISSYKDATRGRLWTASARRLSVYNV